MMNIVMSDGFSVSVVFVVGVMVFIVNFMVEVVNVFVVIIFENVRNLCSDGLRFVMGYIMVLKMSGKVVLMGVFVMSLVIRYGVRV